MPGYFGTQVQQRLQAQSEESAGIIATTPGLCQTGRSMGCDDIDRLGWETIDRFLDRDGVCGFRLIRASRRDELQAELARRGYRFDRWDVFLADRETALAASEQIVARGRAGDLVDLEKPIEPEGAFTADIQSLLAASGIVPFSGSMLTGSLGPATTQVVGDQTGALVAVAHGYMPHNIYSPYSGYAWGGLVAVAGSRRGEGLGTYINARLVTSVFRELQATHIYELVSSSNLQSRRMVEACGLRHEPSLVCGMATRKDSAHFTR